MNNGGGGAFAIVFLLVAVVLGAGFLFNEEIDNQQQQEIAQQVEKQMAEANAEINRQKTALEEENGRLLAENQRLSQELEAARQSNTALSKNLEAAQSANADLTARYVAKEQELNQANTKILELSNSLASRPDTTPLTGEIKCPPENTGSGTETNHDPFTWPMFPIIGAALFGTAVLANRQGRGRQADSRRIFAAESEDIVYVKMNRGEARRYAQAKRKR